MLILLNDVYEVCVYSHNFNRAQACPIDVHLLNSTSDKKATSVDNMIAKYSST